MVMCSVKHCGSRKCKYLPNLTFHKFPANELLRKKWLEIIGSQNINPRHKNWFVCSLHFEENCFNRTLDVIRLHDGVVPSLLVYNTTNVPNLQNTESCVVEPEVSDDKNNKDAQLIQLQNKKIDILTRKCQFLRKKVKSLNEKVRRRNKEISSFSSVVKDLQKKKVVLLIVE